MSTRRYAACVAGVVALMVMGCAGGCAGGGGEAQHGAPHAAAATTQSSASAPEARRVIDLERRVLTFEPTRRDYSVGCAVFSVVSSKPVKVNGVQGEPWSYIYLKQVGKNQFELPALRIEFDLAEPGDIGCMSLKIWFNEVTNYYDSGLYVNNDDRYALVAWTTIPPKQSKDTSYNARFGLNRVESLEMFKQRLAEPFVLRMKDIALKPEWGYPMVHNNGGKLSEADVAAVEKVVRDRGESYLIAVMAGADADHAEVETSVGDMTRFKGTKRYKLARRNGRWVVETVGEKPNFSRNVYW